MKTNNVPRILTSTRIVTGFLLLFRLNGAVFTGASAENGDAAAIIDQAASHVAKARLLLDQLTEDEEAAAAEDIDQEDWDDLEREIGTLNGARRRAATEIDPEYDHEDELLEKSLREALRDVDDEGYKRGVFFALVDAYKKARMDPDAWQSYSYWDLHAYFSCARSFASRRPIYDSERWAGLRQFYHEWVEQDEEKRGSVPEWKPKRTYQVSKETFDMPFEPFQSREKGRSLKATRDIGKGELLFKSTNNTIVFTNGHTWRDFLFDIYERNGEPYDSETACDVLIWSWVQALEEGGPLTIVTDMDNTSLLNEGRDEDGWDRPNVRCGKEGDETCRHMYYATRDIKKGDELLADYTNFAMMDAWPKMGL